MSRRMDWSRAKVRLGAVIHEVTDEVPTAVGPVETGRRYLSAVVEAVLKGRPLPAPSALFLRYFRGQFPDGSVESWLQQQPRYLSALRRRETKAVKSAARKAASVTTSNKPTPARTKQPKPAKAASKASSADIERENLRKLIVRRRKKEGPRPSPVIETRSLPPREP